MGGIKSAVSMGYVVLFVILLYLVGIGISSLIQYIKRNLEGDNRECSNMYYFDHLIVIVSFSIRATIRDRKKADVQGAPDAAEAAADVTVKWNRQRNPSKKAE